jgi:hypothetical protein
MAADSAPPLLQYGAAVIALALLALAAFDAQPATAPPRGRFRTIWPDRSSRCGHYECGRTHTIKGDVVATKDEAHLHRRTAWSGLAQGDPKVLETLAQMTVGTLERSGL